ncbi:MAG: acetolactate decarboxylase [Solidesulfovibrio sp. DCME]|uniref:acetolactate decarboxylase n=1 Tax=Solidesulfovibrio sp. DCME TaxID=3447380 RepID=UPI003D1030A2
MSQCARAFGAAFWTAVFFALSVAAGSAASLYQVGTIESLSAGDYAGRETYAALARHGDFGLGTFTNLDGEMLALDGRFYQVKSDGLVRRASPGQKAPFAQVVFFTGALDLGHLDGLDLAALGQALASRLPDPTRFYAVRVDGLFGALTLRSVPAQHQPWPTLAEAVRRQATFPLTDVAGTLIGIYSPKGTAALSPTGWHFHFLSADGRHGGHVLAATATVAKARGDAVTDLRLVFPEGPTPRGDIAAPAAGTE